MVGYLIELVNFAPAYPYGETNIDIFNFPMSYKFIWTIFNNEWLKGMTKREKKAS